MNRSGKHRTRQVKETAHRTADHEWREGTVQEFLGLSDEEAALIRAKASLAVMLAQRRKAMGWSQTALAERLGSGQSRVAKIEAAHPSVSLDLLVKALLVAGATMSDIGAVMANADSSAITRTNKPIVKRTRRSRKATTLP
jgi:hypothetical protein